MQRPEITNLYAVIGTPLTHSYSSVYWNEKFKEKGLVNYRFDAVELKRINDLPEYIKEHPNLCGMSVTIPYKEQVIPYLDTIDPIAKEIGAVNVVKVEHTENGDAILHGYNTDYLGFKYAIEPMLSPSHKKALILGTGGAAKAIVYALKQIGIESTLVSRDKDGYRKYDEITEDTMREHTIIVNAAHVGSFPIVNQCPNIPYEYMTKHHVVMDVIYNPIRTLFLQQAELKGATTKNGWEMFVEQARKAWDIIIA